MKRLIVGLAVFCIAFQTGLMTKAALFGNGFTCPLPSKEILERQENINEAVFRYQIEHFTPVNTAVYFLSLANDSDPLPETIASLKNSSLPVRRLSELGTYPTSLACYYCPDGETEFIVRVGSIRWLSKDEAIVGGSLRRWRGNTDQAYLFRVVRERGSWVVKEHELL
jgi:hypothetical protein